MVVCFVACSVFFRLFVVILVVFRLVVGIVY